MKVKKFINLWLIIYINRSLSGQGTRKFLVNIKKLNLKIKEIRSGTKVFDWTVPDE